MAWARFSRPARIGKGARRCAPFPCHSRFAGERLLQVPVTSCRAHRRVPLQSGHKFAGSRTWHGHGLANRRNLVGAHRLCALPEVAPLRQTYDLSVQSMQPESAIRCTFRCNSWTMLSTCRAIAGESQKCRNPKPNPGSKSMPPSPGRVGMSSRWRPSTCPPVAVLRWKRSR